MDVTLYWNRHGYFVCGVHAGRRGFGVAFAPQKSAQTLLQEFVKGCQFLDG